MNDELRDELEIKLKKYECRLKQAQVILNDEAGTNLQIITRAGSLRQSVEDIEFR
jgi:cell shape-determining protein MreC